jgi:hypothetical protein
MEENKKIDRKNLVTHMMDYQLELAGKTRLDLVDDIDWKINIYLTIDQYRQFRGYSINLMRKVLKINRKKAEHNFYWFYRLFGFNLKRVDNDRKLDKSGLGKRGPKR